MTLDEAIAIAKESSENQYMGDRGREDYKQLAAWLEELKQYKEENQPEKTAEEMFYDLGYDCIKSDLSIRYIANYEMAEGHIDIHFYLKTQQFYAQCDFDPKDIDMREFKAIQKQIKELGWLKKED
nr:MAG TPA: Ki-ras-induced actin-interacting protein-IP3R-interacting domain [Caudoviricetes sp.]